MKELKENIVNIHGLKGEAWLGELPVIVETLVSDWNLKNITPVANMTYNYVAKALTDDNNPVVVKISCDKNSISEERDALKHFNSNASIKLFDYSEKHNALLLEQAIPGITLTSFYPAEREFVMDCYLETMNKLHQKPVPNNHNYRRIEDWLKAIDKVNSDKVPAHLVEKAITLKNSLLDSSQVQVFLHGDLHHDNILIHKDTWVTIDPKGVVGEPEFEIAAFDFMYVSELANKINIKEIFEDRVDLLAEKANLNAKRIKEWVFVRLILMAAWAIEDNGDPSGAVKLAESII